MSTFEHSFEHSSCGVGFVTSLDNFPTHENLVWGLRGLCRVEHRGGLGEDLQTSDGAGILTDIPHDLIGLPPGDALAHLFLPREPTARVRSIQIFEETFKHVGLEIYQYREIPLDLESLSKRNRDGRPEMLMAFIRRPPYCTTRYNFEKMLYRAKQLTRRCLREAGIVGKFFFASLSAGTVVYKALTSSEDLQKFYLDLSDPRFKTRFCLFHRRFSTNTATTWDTAQPFRVVAHNGEINTISGNRAWAYTREKALGLDEDALLTHRGISDSGSVNEMIEALTFRSSIPHIEDILAILMPPASSTGSFYRFWGRAMEPWDGPALMAFCEGRTIGARLDRSGFRPCRWSRTADRFFLSSEAGTFELDESEVLEKGCLSGGESVTIDLRTGAVQFADVSKARENDEASFDPRVKHLPYKPPPKAGFVAEWNRLNWFGFTHEDFHHMLLPILKEGKEPIGSMGDTARFPTFSLEQRSLFDHFYQHFAQVTNPPVDYLREKIVTDMRVTLGRKPNIFEPKELLPPRLGIELQSPVLSLGQMAFIRGLCKKPEFEGTWPSARVFDATFPSVGGEKALREAFDRIEAEVVRAISDRVSVFIFSDRKASPTEWPIPMVLLISRLILKTNDIGMRLRISTVFETGEVRNSHDLSVLIGFGAAAVCPYLMLEAAIAHPEAQKLGHEENAAAREKKILGALESGLMRTMAKMGVSVLRSYHGAQLFTILGLSKELHREFFPHRTCRIGGLGLSHLVENIRRRMSLGSETLVHPYLLKEHPQGKMGEKHSVTLAHSKVVHKLLTNPEHYPALLESRSKAEPIHIRHLLQLRTGRAPLALEEAQSTSSILKTFGSGAMSFGAISADAQRDIFLALEKVGGRSNSGEGGENPYYFQTGITATTKQIASGRFGVTAEYLVTGREIQIKMAQGAKPGEGGQLMAPKVSKEIARARHSAPHIDLISPPPMHDIYSIEDLKQLILELRQLAPEAQISVKLVSGENIGTIAVGVAKAGADVIHISGHDGGTGAASLLSMKHAGLPWEMGLLEVHRALVEQNLRDAVKLRVDGGLESGKDVLMACAMGAEEFDFGKMLLIAEGCILARVCEKNNCPTGIATQDPKFQRLYRGTPEKVVALLQLIAEEVQSGLAELGLYSLSDLVGRTDWFAPHPVHAKEMEKRGVELDYFFGKGLAVSSSRPNPYRPSVTELNAELREAALSGEASLAFKIRTSDRGVPAALIGDRARYLAKTRKLGGTKLKPLSIFFKGSAGQGFGVFLTEGVSLRLEGEANDSVGKSMSGGEMILVPPSDSAMVEPAQSAILGNCALYGATGGVLFAYGKAGNRFGVRNSGATSVVEGTGMHSCEYMTGGTIAILGEAGRNIGAGMTGGRLFLLKSNLKNLNREYLEWRELTETEHHEFRALLEHYHSATGSVTASKFLSSARMNEDFLIALPIPVLTRQPSPETEPEMPNPPGFLIELPRSGDIVPG